MLIPEDWHAPGFGVVLVAFDASAEVRLRSSLSSTHDVINVTPFTITFTTAAFDRSSLWLFEASPYRATPKGQPSSLVQLRTAVWTGATRDTLPGGDITAMHNNCGAAGAGD